ncbi:response regulator [Streptomyces sp. NPDC018693]|uniref:response regulator n=1 Tax=unclassified Streptomyces TaxID=2593676 RepID=UPI00379BBA70
MIRVLVVDDDFMVARIHRKLVERLPGFTVVGEARTGADALRSVRELRPDLVLLDIYLPDIGGLDVLRELRGGEVPGAEVDVMVVTAAQDVATLRGALRGGAVHYIIKPFDSSVLHERLQQYAERRRELAALAVPEQDDVDRVFGTAAPDSGPGGGTGDASAGSGYLPGIPAPAAAPGGSGAAGSSSVGAAGPVAARLPKGVTEQTADLVRRNLTAHAEGMSASECAGATGLSRVSARRYLEFFVSTGQARVFLRYGTTGRPERRYHWLADTARPAGVEHG